MITTDERDYLIDRLHSPGMQCRQCEITRRLLDGARVRCPVCGTSGTGPHSDDECRMMIEERAWKNRT